MADPTITYGSYTFPTPSPLVAETSNPIVISGQSDFFLDEVNLVGTLTGANLSGLHVRKMQMVSGLLSEFQTLTVTGDNKGKFYSGAKPTSISFSESDLTTILPYSVTFEAYSSGAFSNFFGVVDPQDNWTFSEQDGRISNVSHVVSARGLNLGNSVSALTNAKNFVSGRITGSNGGYRDISLFQTGTKAFLRSRTETIDNKASSYSVTEEYNCSTSDNRINNNPSGILESNAEISLDSQGKVSVSINGSLKGSIDANSTGALLTTGNFTPTQAQELAVNAVASSLSDFESGAYTFSNVGPSSYEYQLNTGSNTLNFTFTFSDSSNTEQSGNILHTKSASVSCSKDDANTKVSINGDLKYHSNSAVINSTGDPTSSQQWLELRREFSGINFFNLAVEALQDFTGNATGYQISGLNLNQTPIESGVNKNPFEGTISYNVSFDNKLDLSNGDLTGLRVSITDTRPIQVSGIKPSIAGFATQNVKERQMGLYAVSATCEGDTGTLPTLANNVNKYITGVFDQAKSESVGENTISFNLSRYY
tara:strand:+ start:1009 stop:2622 length:1614 start_codon:yes stop_codon:yes gene_type:complete